MDDNDILKILDEKINIQERIQIEERLPTIEEKERLIEIDDIINKYSIKRLIKE